MLSRNLDQFRVLVLCARELQPSSRFFPRTRVIRCPFDDGLELDPKDARMVASTAHVVAKHVRQGERCLVTCNAGLNRSGLVTAMTLHLLTGYPGSACVDIVQEARPGALFNEAFVRQLRELPARAARLRAPREAFAARAI